MYYYYDQVETGEENRGQRGETRLEDAMTGERRRSRANWKS
jgi:hypothetical protein